MNCNTYVRALAPDLTGINLHDFVTKLDNTGQGAAGAAAKTPVESALRSPQNLKEIIVTFEFFLLSGSGIFSTLKAALRAVFSFWSPTGREFQMFSPQRRQPLARHFPGNFWF